MSDIIKWFDSPLYRWIDQSKFKESAAVLRDHMSVREMTRLLKPAANLTLKSVTFYPAGMYDDPERTKLTNVGDFWEVKIDQNVGNGHTAAMRVYLPVRWNGRFMGIAGGGTNNEIDWFTAPRFNVLTWPIALKNGYACAVTDNDSGTRLNCDWGFKPDGTLEWDHIESFIHTALHEATVWGKKIVAAAYEQAPVKNYLHGTSGGGRQVLTEAVRYPEDYDGLWADGPAVYHLDLVFASLWAVIVEENEHHVVPLEKYQAAYALARADETIGDQPFDITKGCFRRYLDKLIGMDTAAGPITRKDLYVMVKTWRGPFTKDGVRMAYGYGPTIRQWPLATGNPLYGYFRRQDDGRLIVMPIAAQVIRWMTGNPDLDIHDLSYADFETLWRNRSRFKCLDFTASDLTAFAKRGGKLIITQGTGDPVVPFEAAFDYYRDMSDHFPSEKIMNDSIRMFVEPFAGHSILDWSGPAVALSDGMAALTRWTETGKAPDRLPAQRYDFDHDCPVQNDIIPPYNDWAYRRKYQTLTRSF